MISEDTIIARYFAPISGNGALGLLDDAAMLPPPPGHDLVLTKDALVSGVHFFADDPPASIARKALRVNLSDLAAKGAVPAGFLLAMALPRGIDESWIAAFASALGEDARAYACPLLGGDTVKASGGLTLSITTLGYCPAGGMVQRTKGKPGHALMVTGTIGDAALGLQVRLKPEAEWVCGLSDHKRHFLVDRYLHPRPRTALTDVIRAHASAAMDVSDGLLGDAVKLASSAGAHGIRCAAAIDLGQIPLSPAAREALRLQPSLITTIATGGDDYEVLMAVDERVVPALADACAQLGCPATRIGSLIDGTAPAFTGLNGASMTFDALKFEHDWQV